VLLLLLLLLLLMMMMMVVVMMMMMLSGTCTLVAPDRPSLATPPSLDTDLTRNTRAPHFSPQHWLLCHMGLY